MTTAIRALTQLRVRSRRCWMIFDSLSVPRNARGALICWSPLSTSIDEDRYTSWSTDRPYRRSRFRSQQFHRRKRSFELELETYRRNVTIEQNNLSPSVCAGRLRVDPYHWMMDFECLFFVLLLSTAMELCLAVEKADQPRPALCTFKNKIFRHPDHCFVSLNSSDRRALMEQGEVAEDEFWEGLQSLGLGHDLSRSHVSRIVKPFKASGTLKRSSGEH